MAMAATSCALVPAFVGGRRRAPSRRRAAAAVVRCSLDTNVSDMAVNGERGSFGFYPPHCLLFCCRNGLDKTTCLIPLNLGGSVVGGIGNCVLLLYVGS
jgi:hypothetical protein